MTTIVSKYGYGQPANTELAKGEIGIDLQNSAIYTSTDGSDIIALGITEVQWGDIIGVPPELIVGGDGYVDLSTLEEAVVKNAGDIAALQATVGQVQSDLADAIADIAVNAAAIGVNAEAISDNASAISANTGNINSLNSQINDSPNGLVHLIAANTTQHEANASEIAALWSALGDAQTGLVLGGKYDAKNNMVVGNPTPEGAEAGLVEGQNLPIDDKTKGIYVIVTVGGELEGIEANPGTSDSHKSNGDMAYPGDWLLSDGQHGWILMDFHTDATEWGMIGGDVTAQTDLMDYLSDTYLAKDGVIDGGTYAAV
jgi:hypothetical protein